MDAPFPALDVVDSYFPANPQPCPLPHPNPTKSFWLNSAPDCNPLADEGKDAPLPDKGVDILIIGSGITGIFTLYHLIQRLKTSSRGISSIAILEARQFCSGATGRNGGHCTAYNPVAFASEAKKYGTKNALAHADLERRAVDLVLRLIKANSWEKDVDLVSGGNIHLISTQEEHDVLARELQAAKDAGLDLSGFEWLSKEDCSKLIKSRSHLSGIKIPGNNLYPLKLVTKVFELARSEAASIGVDVSLYTHTAVESIAPTNDIQRRSWNTKTSRGDLQANQIIHCTNAYASHVLHDFATGRDKIVPCRNQVMAIRPQVHEQFWKCAYNEGFEYFFQRPVSTPSVPSVILGGGRSVAPEPHELDISDDSGSQPVVTKYLRGFLPHHFPALFPDKRVEADYSWSGIMGFTQSRNPFVGGVYQNGSRLKGQYISAGYSGHGMSRAPACAEVIADMAIAEAEGRTLPSIDWMPDHLWTKP